MKQEAITVASQAAQSPEIAKWTVISTLGISWVSIQDWLSGWFKASAEFSAFAAGCLSIMLIISHGFAMWQNRKKNRLDMRIKELEIARLEKELAETGETNQGDNHGN